MTKTLTSLFNIILTLGKSPSEWKKPYIILLYKKGDKHSIKNYRPTSLSPVLSKFYSKLIETRIN